MTEISKNSIIGNVLDEYPETAAYFLEIGMHCLGCPASRNETIEQACELHGADCDELIERLKNHVGQK